MRKFCTLWTEEPAVGTLVLAEGSVVTVPVLYGIFAAAAPAGLNVFSLFDCFPGGNSP